MQFLKHVLTQIAGLFFSILSAVYDPCDLCGDDE